MNRLSLTHAIVMVGLTAAAAPAAFQNPHPSNERPANAQILLTKTRDDGSYALSALARVCGELPAELNFAGVPVFTVGFYPDPPTGKDPINDITFNSKELVGKATTASQFFLSVTVRRPNGSMPPAYVFDTTAKVRKSTGTATIATPAPGVTVLTVRAMSDLGEVVDLTLRCSPRK